MNAETMLDVLGNRTRREIIHLISEEPRCLTELSEETGVEKMAIMRHLKRMEEAGVLTEEEEKIERGRPRKNYEIGTKVKLKVKVAPDDFEAKLWIPRVRRFKSRFELENKFKEIKDIGDSARRLQLFRELTDHLTNEIQKHEEDIYLAEDLLARVRKESLKSRRK